jgi:histidine triad (HIT) family protein
MHDEKCPFCNITPALFIKETKHSVVLINLMQVSRTDAILIVPKNHVKNILELSDEEYQDFTNTIKEVYATLTQHDWNKFNILINEGLLADQNIPHLHAHIFSRTEKDGIKNMRRPNRKNILTEWNPEKTEKFLQTLKGYFTKDS